MPRDDNNNNYNDSGYDAYTQPADADNAPRYSFSYDGAPPTYPPQTEGEPRPKRKRHAGRIAAVIIIVLALIVVSTAVVWLCTSYDLKISSDDGVLSVQLIPEGSAPELPEVYSPGAEPEPSADAETGRGDMEWDGTTLEILPRPTASVEEGLGRLSYQQVYRKCAPSVVVIQTNTGSEMYSGTGVIMTEDGYIVTCSHLVTDKAAMTVVLEDGTEYDAVLMGQDDQTDLAVLKIDAHGLAAAEFGDSGELQVGDEVAAIGNPMSQNLTMTNGIISAIDRDVEHNGYTMTLLQTNAAINEGNSGGPLINMYGQVIGITNMKMMSYYSTVEGIGFAIPVSSAKPIIDELLQHGYIAGRPAIGIVPSDIPSAAAAYYGLPQGVFVDHVYENTDAYAKGLRRGDVITAVDGDPVTGTNDLNLTKAGYVAGDTVTLTVYRAGEYVELLITLCDLAELG